jgi:threonine dehydratase
MDHRLKLERIEEARRVIDPVFLNTPQYRAESLESSLECRLVLKVETLNPIRSFKGRGASYYVATAPNQYPIVCASAGNFGQAIGYACRATGRRSIVYASIHANPFKIERMRALGAEVRLFGEDFDAAKIEARRFAAESGFCMVEDSLTPETCEGAGTIAAELLQWPEPLDAVLVALGNGALLTGMGHWIKARSPATQVIGIGAKGAPAMADSWKAGRIIQYSQVDTIADGIAVRVPIPEVLADMCGLIDDVLLVNDDAILHAMKLLHRQMGLVVEPSAAVGVAALQTFSDRFKGKRVATVLCGSNLTPKQMREWLAD